MNTLIIFAIATFTLMPSGETQQAIAQVKSVTECAELINRYRHPLETTDGGMAYMTDATCFVREQPRAK